LKRWEFKSQGKLLVIVLAINIILTSINLYMITQSSANLKLQSKINTLNIIVTAEDADLGKPVAYFFGENGNFKKTIHVGTLNAHLRLTMPHYGVVTIKLKGFNVTESKYLDDKQLYDVEVQLDERDKQVYVLAPGFNQIVAQIRLKAVVPLNSETILSDGESIRFPIGRIFFEVETYDFETRTSMSSEFSSKVFVTVEKPPFLD